MISNYIGGKFILSSSTESIPVINPATGTSFPSFLPSFFLSFFLSFKFLYYFFLSTSFIKLIKIGVELYRCPLSNTSDVEQAINIAKDVFQDWKLTTIKQRTSIMLKFYSLVNQHSQELAEVRPNKNFLNFNLILLF